MNDRRGEQGCLGRDQLIAWASRAHVGESVVYARGETLPPQARAATADLIDTGLVAPVAKRRGAGWAFILQRASAPFIDPAEAAARRRQPSRGVARPQNGAVGRASERAIYRILLRRANAGLACPNDASLAAMAGLSGRLAASYRMRRLVAAGLIAIERPDPTRPRIVTIIATGKRTAA